MPKERLHMLIAAESLRILNAAGSLSLGENRWPAFLLGAMSPDILFYDVPYFHLNAVGTALHRLEGEASVAFFRRWIEEDQDGLPGDIQAWMLGVTTHFLADALWHPLINELSAISSGLCRNLNLSIRFCHHWLESELETLWLARIGPADKYTSLLNLLGRERTLIEKCASYYKKMLIRAEISTVPAETKIMRCFLWQNFSLRQFSHPAWIKRREWLLKRSWSCSLGALVVPGEPNLPALLSSRMPANQSARTLCDGAFMAKTVTLLATRLLELPVRI